MTETVHQAEIVPSAPTALAQATSMEATIAAGVEAQMRATVQARYMLAIRMPRDYDLVRQRLLKECKRPRFAEIARYAKPQGKIKDDNGNWVDNFVIGPSIRFAEAAMRAYGNILEETAILHDDETRRVVRVSATDLESNLTFCDDVLVLKQVERSDARGRTIISSRKNSYDKTVYTVVATEDEILQRQASLISKALRNSVLRMIPRDLRDECMDQVVATQKATDKKDPDEQRKRLFDAFAVLGISPSDIKDYLGHEVGLEDLDVLRGLYQSIKQGDVKWSELVAAKRADSETSAPSGDLKEKLKQKANGNGTKTTEAPKFAPAVDPAAIETWKVELQTASGDERALTEVYDRAKQAVGMGTELDALYLRMSQAARDGARQ